MASSQEPAEPAATPDSPGSPDAAEVPDAEGLVATPRPRLPVEVAARLAAWEEQDEARRTREHQEAAAVAEAAEAARAARSAQRRAPGGQKSCASITSASKHHSGDKSRPDPNRPRVQTERFRLRHGASAEEMLRDYRRLVTYPRQCPVLRAQLVLRSRPLALDHGQTVNSRYRQAAAEYQQTTLSTGTSAKGDVIVVSTAPAVTDFRNPPKQGPSKLPPPKWDRWLASRHPPDREDAALVPTPVHLPPLPGEASGTSVWAAIGARDSWTSFKLDSPPPARTPSARSARPQTSPRDQPQPSPPSQPQPCWQSVRPSPASQPQPWWLSARPSPPSQPQPGRPSPPQPGRPSPPPLVRVPPPPPPPARVVSTRLDLESCLSVVSLQAPDIAPAYRPRPQAPPPRRFEMVRNYSTGDSPAAGLTVTPVLQPARAPAGRQRRSSPPRPPEPTLSEPTSLSTWPASSLSARSSHSAPNSPRTIPNQTRR